MRYLTSCVVSVERLLSELETRHEFPEESLDELLQAVPKHADAVLACRYRRTNAWDAENIEDPSSLLNFYKSTTQSCGRSQKIITYENIRTISSLAPPAIVANIHKQMEFMDTKLLLVRDAIYLGAIAYYAVAETSTTGSRIMRKTESFIVNASMVENT
jgi:hypothetical protein